MTPTLGADLLAVVARINRLATQRARLPLPFAQGRLLSTIEDQGAARISDLAALDHCSQPTMTTQVRGSRTPAWCHAPSTPDDARAVLIRITPKGSKTLTAGARRPRRGRRSVSGAARRRGSAVAFMGIGLVDRILNRSPTTLTPHRRRSAVVHQLHGGHGRRDADHRRVVEPDR